MSINYTSETRCSEEGFQPSVHYTWAAIKYDPFLNRIWWGLFAKSDKISAWNPKNCSDFEFNVINHTWIPLLCFCEGLDWGNMENKEKNTFM